MHNLFSNRNQYLAVAHMQLSACVHMYVIMKLPIKSSSNSNSNIAPKLLILKTVGEENNTLSVGGENKTLFLLLI